MVYLMLSQYALFEINRMRVSPLIYNIPVGILFQLIIVTTQPSPTMCKGRPTHNEGQEISSSNTEVGLINFSAEEWSLDRPKHRTV